MRCKIRYCLSLRLVFSLLLLISNKKLRKTSNLNTYKVDNKVLTQPFLCEMQYNYCPSIRIGLNVVTFDFRWLNLEHMVPLMVGIPWHVQLPQKLLRSVLKKTCRIIIIVHVLYKSFSIFILFVLLTLAVHIEFIPFIIVTDHIYFCRCYWKRNCLRMQKDWAKCFVRNYQRYPRIKWPLFEAGGLWTPWLYTTVRITMTSVLYSYLFNSRDVNNFHNERKPSV